MRDVTTPCETLNNPLDIAGSDSSFFAAEAVIVPMIARTRFDSADALISVIGIRRPFPTKMCVPPLARNKDEYEAGMEPRKAGEE